MTIFHKLDKLKQTWRDNPRPKDTSDWVKEIMSKPTKEERRQVLDQVPNAIRAHVATRVEQEFQKLYRKPK